MCRITDQRSRKPRITCLSNQLHLQGKVNAEKQPNAAPIPIEYGSQKRAPQLLKRRESQDNSLKLPPIRRSSPENERLNRDKVYNSGVIFQASASLDIDPSPEMSLDGDLPLGASSSPVFHHNFDTTSFINKSIMLYDLKEESGFDCLDVSDSSDDEDGKDGGFRRLSESALSMKQRNEGFDARINRFLDSLE